MSFYLSIYGRVYCGLIVSEAHVPYQLIEGRVHPRSHSKKTRQQMPIINHSSYDRKDPIPAQ